MSDVSPSTPCVTVSVVSHGQHVLVNQLLGDLARCPEVARVVLTLNIPEPECTLPAGFAERVTLLRNASPKGFGANHNAALQGVESPFVCILNPDIRISENPFPALLDCMRKTSAGLAAPRVLNLAGDLEDSARYFPTPLGLLRKLLVGTEGRFPLSDTEPSEPDWVAGMFMLARNGVFRGLGGFDEGYFLYYEDVDFCVRLRSTGLKLVLCPLVSVIHDARRASRRNPRYMAWHVSSMLRFFLKHGGRVRSARGG